jgi:hypothetical protein
MILGSSLASKVQRHKGATVLGVRSALVAHNPFVPLRLGCRRQPHKPALAFCFAPLPVLRRTFFDLGEQ